MNGLSCTLRRAALALVLMVPFLAISQPACAAETIFFTDFDGTVSGWDWHTHLTGDTAHWGQIAGMGQPAHSGTADIFFQASVATAGDRTLLSRQDPIALNRYTDLYLEYAIYHETSNPTANDRIQAMVSTTSGVSWDTVGSAVSRYDGTTGWEVVHVDLSGYDRASSFRFGLAGIAEHGTDIYIDDIGLYGTLNPFTPDEGTIGTRVHIYGSGFGDLPGKALIGGMPLKTSSWSAISITGTISKIPSGGMSGHYDAQVFPKTKGAPVVQLSPPQFLFHEIELDSVSPTSGAPGDTVTISGSFFGTAKGKITFSGPGLTKPLSAKVLSWTMNPDTNESEVQILVPAKLPVGTHDVIVANKMSEDFLIGVFERTP